MTILNFVSGLLLIPAIAAFAGDRKQNATAVPTPRDAQALVAMATDSQGTPAPSPGQSLVEQSPSIPGFQDRYPRYELCPNDVITIQFTYTPELNQSVTVQPDGFITLAQIGDLHVAGKTLRQVRQTLESAYSKILRDPVFSVELKDFEKPYLTVFGQVHNPGKLELRGPTTVIGAIGAAGGFNADAKHSQVLLFRRVSSQWIQVRVLNVKQMLNSGNIVEDANVQPGDLIFVPKNTISKVRPWIPYYGFGLSFSSSNAF